jgi:hypothetical protein
MNSLEEALKIATNSKPNAVGACKFRKFLNEIPQKDRELLEKTIYAHTGKVLAQALILNYGLDTKRSVLSDQITKHRSGACSCY